MAKFCFFKILFDQYISLFTPIYSWMKNWQIYACLCSLATETLSAWICKQNQITYLLLIKIFYWSTWKYPIYELLY